MTGRCRSWMRTWQRGNMPILLKTQIERTAKAPIPACHARVGSLCGFRSPAERVPAGSHKTGRCASVRELWRKWQARSQHQMERATSPRTSKREKSRDFERCGEKAGQSRGVVRAPAAVTSARGAGSFGGLRGRSKRRKNQPWGVAE